MQIMDNSRPPAWVLVNGPDGKQQSHLEWPTCKFYSIMMDETTDNHMPSKEQISFCVHTVNTDFSVNDHFMEFYHSALMTHTVQHCSNACGFFGCIQ